MAERARKRNSRATPALPRYAEIRRALERAIVSGNWPPGHRIPSEQQLLARYRCSRMTVNKALSALVESGMIVRRRRSGSFVAVPAGRSVLQIHDIEQDVRLSGRSYRLDLRARTERKASRSDARRLEVAAGTPILALECLHFVDGHALVLEDRLINLAAVPAARRADFTVRSPGSWLLERVPWSQAEHRISAVNASLRIAGALSIAEGFACLVVERRTRHARGPVTHVTLVYPGDRYELQARFDPSGTPD
jgi:GntR family histidine utilization transcriptional repressor